MQFGVTVPNYRRLASPDNLVMVTRRTEELGFDSLWVTDHVVVPEAHREMFGATVYDPLSVLAFLGVHLHLPFHFHGGHGPAGPGMAHGERRVPGPIGAGRRGGGDTAVGRRARCCIGANGTA